MGTDSRKNIVHGKYLRTDRVRRLNEFLNHASPNVRHHFRGDDFDLTVGYGPGSHGYLRDVVNIERADHAAGIYAVSYRICLHKNRKKHILDNLEERNRVAISFLIEDRNKERYHIVYWEEK